MAAMMVTLMVVSVCLQAAWWCVMRVRAGGRLGLALLTLTSLTLLLLQHCRLSNHLHGQCYYYCCSHLHSSSFIFVFVSFLLLFYLSFCSFFIGQFISCSLTFTHLHSYCLILFFYLFYLLGHSFYLSAFLQSFSFMFTHLHLLSFVILCFHFIWFIFVDQFTFFHSVTHFPSPSFTFFFFFTYL